MQVFGAMVAGKPRAFWQEALVEMRNAGHLTAGGRNLFAQLRIPYEKIPAQAQV